jgi:hypothetical protein
VQAGMKPAAKWLENSQRPEKNSRLLVQLSAYRRKYLESHFEIIKLNAVMGQ